MKNLIFAIVFISPPFLKKLILKWYCRAKFGKRTTIGWFSSVIGNPVAIGDYSTIKPLTLIRCDGEVKIGDYSEISSFSLIYGCASFRVGNRCYIGPQTWINVSEDVEMGSEVGIGPRTMIFTHGSFLPYTEGYPVRFGKISIGNKVWIPADVFIHPGVNVGDNVLVNSRSVLKKPIPPGQYVEGFPAKEICAIEQIRRQVTPAKRDDLILNILKHFVSFLTRINNQMQITYSSPQSVTFRLRRKNCLILLVKSQETVPPEFPNDRYDRTVVLLNHAHWTPTLSTGKTTIFDFTTMKVSYSKNKLCRQFHLFLKQYYGLIFEYV